MKIINYTLLREGLKHYMDEVSKKNSVIAITSRGKKPCVLISLDEFNRLTEKKNNKK